MRSTLTASLSILLLGAGLATAQPKAAPTLKSVLLDQLRASHSVQDWYVPASKAVAGMTFEQAAWHQGDNHSVAQLVNHLTFWNSQQLAKFRGEKPARPSAATTRKPSRRPRTRRAGTPPSRRWRTS